MPNTGLRLADSEVAAGILKRESVLGLSGREIIRLAGHDCWNKKPDYQGGGQGPSTAEVFAEAGIYLVKADPSRPLKLRQFRERVRVREDELPMMMVAESCNEFWRAITTLPMDENNVEDVDTNAENHIFDEAAQFCRIIPAKPIGVKLKERHKACHSEEGGTKLCCLAGNHWPTKNLARPTCNRRFFGRRGFTGMQ